MITKFSKKHLAGCSKFWLPLLAIGALAGLACLAGIALASSSEQILPIEPLLVARQGHTATVLVDGRVLITGGVGTNGVLALAEIFDPETRSFVPVAATMLGARAGHTATKLDDGRVLIAGGSDGNSPLTSAEIFDPATEMFGSVGAMTSARIGHTATRLLDGRVFIAGGDAGGTAEIFDPATGLFVAVPGPMAEARAGHTATLFADNSVFLAGGGTDSAEYFDVATQTFTLTPYRLAALRSGHAAIATADEKLLLFGGDAGNSVERFYPPEGPFSVVLTLGTASSTATLLANEKILVLGPGLAAVFDPMGDQLTALAGADSLQRSGHTATVLPGDKKVLVAGGLNSSNELVAAAALFNPARIETDMDDYPPGATIFITGTGFLPGEPVELNVLHIDGTANDGLGHDIWTAQADAVGNLFDVTWYVCEDDCLDSLLELTAKGLSSGLIARTSFTDAARVGSVSVGAQSPATVCPGGLATFVVTVNRQGSGGGAFTATVSLTTALPAGTSATFNPTNVVFASADNSKTSTLTISTTAGTTPGGTTSFTVNATGGGGSANATGSLVVGGTPSVTTNPTNLTVCAGSTASFNSAASGTPAPTVQWQANSGSGFTNIPSATSSPLSFTASLSQNGNQFRALFNATCGSATSSVATLTVNASPSAPTASNNGPICAGQTLQLSASTVSGAIYSWTGPNGFTSSQQNPSIPNATTAATGTYSVTVSIGGCTSAAATTIATVNAVPATPTASNNGPICEGLTLNLSTPTRTGATYSWTGPNGFSSSLQNPSIPNATPAASGTYSVTVTVNGCTSAAGSTTATVNAKPTCSISGADPVCAGANSIQYTAPGGLSSYDWSISGNGSISGPKNKQTVSVDAGAAGSFTLTLTITANNGCSSTCTKTVTVNPIPAAPTASNNGPICSGQTLQLNASTVAGATYGWTGPNGFSSSLQNPSIPNATTSASGTYSVTVTVNGCTSAAGTTTATVNPLPNATITAPSPVCANSTGNSASVPDAGAGATYAWTISGGTITSATNIRTITWTAGSGSTVTLDVTVTSGAGCSASGTKNVTVNPNPTCSISGDDAVCPQSSGHGYTGPGGLSYNWSITGNGSISGPKNQQSATVNASGVGSFTLTLTVTDANGCSSTCSKTVAVVDTEPPQLTCPADITTTNDPGNCTANVSAGTATATDNCSATVSGTRSDGKPLTSPYAVGTTIITWTATDVAGNSTNCTQTITVNDTEMPTITCPSNVTTNTDVGQCYATGVVLDTPTTADNCGVATVVNDAPAQFPKGTTTVTWTVTDIHGNSATCTQMVTVLDQEPPTLTQGTIDSCYPTVEAAEAAAKDATTATDNCPGALTEVASTTGDCSATITVTVTDEPGNSASVQYSTRIDNTPPELSANPADTTVECDAVPVAATVTATDNCDGSVTVEFSEERIDGDCPDSYTLKRAWKSTDTCGNATTYIQTITVQDTTAPVLSDNPADTTVECDSVPAAAIISASDNCDDDVPVGYTESRIDGDCPDNYTLKRTWTTIDDCGNTTTYTQTIAVQDTTAPVLSDNPADTTVECDSVPAAAIISASDNCDDDVPVGYTETRIDGDCPDNYTLKRTWTATDDCGNTTSHTQTIAVVDTTKPVLSDMPVDTTVECDAVPAAAAITATDNCDDNVPVGYSEDRIDGACPDSYTLKRTWTATDDCGNTTSHTQTIAVVDTTKPVLSDMPADTTVECDSVPAAAAITATDNCDDNVPVGYSEDRIDGSCPDSYTLKRTWTATDDCGNTTSHTQTIAVLDTTKPVLSGMPADTTVECDAVPAAAAITATDNCDDNVPVGYTETRIDGSCPDSYTLKRTWTATDDCGNTTTHTQTITVQDTTKPVLSDMPADTTVECDAVPAAAAITASDNCDDDVPVGYTETRIDGSCPDSYTLKRTWTATDDCGNTTSHTQTIAVVDTTKPVLSDMPVDTTVECDAVPAAAAITASDNCDDNVPVGYIENRIDGNCPSNYTLKRTWTATDDCSNTTTHTQTITVQDTTAPIFSGCVDQTVTYALTPKNFTGSVQLKFNDTPIPAGRYIWFNSILKIKGKGSEQTTVMLENSSIVFTAGSVTYTQAVPNAKIIVSPTATMASTTFDTINNQWVTTVPSKADDHVFLAGAVFPVPTALPGNITATWTGEFSADRLGVTADWKAGAAVYTSFSTSLNALGVKPVNGTQFTSYMNSDKAGTPENYKAFVVAGATGRADHCDGGKDYTGRRTANKHVVPKKKGALMTSCDGVVIFNEPTASDNCGSADVECNPPSGSILGAGVHTITGTAVDECGNVRTSSFQLTVLAPFRVVFRPSLEDDNMPDNIETDNDFSNRFKSGSGVPHKIKLYDCTGNDVTESIAPLITVKLEMTERQQLGASSVLINDVPEDYSGVGGPGGMMVLIDKHFQFNLKTTGYEAGTVNNNRFFRSRVTVIYNSNPTIIVGEEDATLESK